MRSLHPRLVVALGILFLASTGGPGCSEPSSPSSSAPSLQGAARSLSAQDPTLVQDINRQGVGSRPSSTAIVNDTLYFFVNTDSRSELWRSNGTPGGTSRVKDFASATQRPSFRLMNIGGTLFLDSYTNGVWQSDGTAGGTVRVEAPSGVFMGEDSVVWNGRRYALAGDGLWSSDGGPWGTARVKELPLGWRPPLLPVQQKLFFRSPMNATQGAGVWQSDGTEAGTTQVFSAVKRSEFSSINDFESANGLVFFPVDDGSAIRELWRTDGTAAGTLRLHEGIIYSNWLVGTSTKLFFLVAVPAPDPMPWTGELWTSDGSVAGTVRIKSLDGSPWPMVPSAGGVLFFVRRPEMGTELWRSDGTAAGTVLVKNLCFNTIDGQPQVLSTVAGVTFFSLGCEGEGTEPWRSDGTAAGTLRLRDIQPGARGSAPGSPVELNGSLYFWADDGTQGPELWKSDGTGPGTVPVLDIVPAKAGSDPLWLTPFGQSLVFTADDGLQGLGLWRSDGTRDSAVRLKSLSISTPRGSPLLTQVTGTLFFADYYGQELWKSDGTVAGTVLVHTAPTPNSWSINNMAAVGNSLFLGATGGLWKSDGTDAGTVLVKPTPLAITSMAEVSGKLFFLVGGLSSRIELWKSDGTEAGTGPVRVLVDSGWYDGPLVRVNDKVFFRISSEGSRQLWQSDGTDAGTSRVAASLEVPERLDAIAGVGGVLYMVSDDGRKLWRSDGSSPATLVKDLFPKARSSELPLFHHGSVGEVRGQVHWTVFAPGQGWMLWRSDGTAEGTVLVLRVELGHEPVGDTTSFARFAEAGKRLFFVNDGGEGRELWTLPFSPILCPNDIIAEAEDPSGAVVALPTPQRAADVDPTLPIHSNYNPVDHFPMGRTDVTLIASDPAYPADTCTYSVEVRDSTGPELQCPKTMRVQSGAVVEYPPLDVRDAVSAPTVTYNPPSGSSFPVGSTLVTVTAKDAANNTSACRFIVEVDDASGCGCGSASPPAVGWLLALGAAALRRRAGKRR